MTPPRGQSGLLDASGTPIPARRVAGIRARAALSGPGAGGFAYDGAMPYSQDMADWYPSLRSPDGEINVNRDRMVARSRDLVRNDGWASGGIDRILDAAIGNQFRLNARPDFRALQLLDRRFDVTWAAEFAAATEAEWRLYAEDPNRWSDAEGQQTLTQQFRTALRHKLVDGESLCQAVWDPEIVGPGAARYATCLHVMDPDRLSNPQQGIDTHDRRGGVQLLRNRPVGYWIREGHQNDWYDAARAMTWNYWPRWVGLGRPYMIHDFSKDRGGQHRGTGILAPVLSRFKMLAKFDQVSLQAAVLRAVVGFFLKSPFDVEQMEAGLSVEKDPQGREYFDGPAVDWMNFRDGVHQQAPVTMGGVRLPTLAPGESIEQVQAEGQAAEFAGFQKYFIRSIATCTGQAEQDISNDYEGVNYSSHRGAVLTAYRTLLRRRTDFGHGTATPFYAAWLEEAVDLRRMPLPRAVTLQEFAEFRAAFARCNWIGPGRGWVDPVKERQGELLGLEAGFGTLAGTCADIAGSDWRDVADQRAVEQAYWNGLGLAMPSWSGGRNMAPSADAQREEETA